MSRHLQYWKHLIKTVLSDFSLIVEDEENCVQLNSRKTQNNLGIILTTNIKSVVKYNANYSLLIADNIIDLSPKIKEINFIHKIAIIRDMDQYDILKENLYAFFIKDCITRNTI